MLQRPQLATVVKRYTREIAGLETFLANAGIPVQTGGAISDVAARLRRDRAFHRDLALNVWVALDGHNSEINHADLLGVLAIAAAGLNFATSAEEEDAHELLRFVMETKRAVAGGALSDSKKVVPAEARIAADVSSEDFKRTAGSLAKAAQNDQRPTGLLMPGEGIETRKGGWGRWAGVAACLLLTALTALLLRHRVAQKTSSAAPHWASTDAGSHAVAPSAISPTVGAEKPAGASIAEKTGVPDGRVSPPTMGDRLRNLFVRSAPPLPRGTIGVAPSATATHPVATPLVPHGSAGGPVGGEVAAVTPSSAGVVVLSAGSVSSVGVASSFGSAAAGPVATFGKPIVRPSIEWRMAQGENGSGGNGDVPHLLRRHPLMPFVEYVEPMETAVPGSSSASSVGASRGVVRQTSMGIMAGNVVYSPVPAYPAAASAAHVQGEVKIEAEVDRNGNVASSRVLSGPALLRDAAQDAVQRWRFKPYMAGGKPVAMAATAIVEFELP